MIAESRFLRTASRVLACASVLVTASPATATTYRFVRSWSTGLSLPSAGFAFDARRSDPVFVVEHQSATITEAFFFERDGTLAASYDTPHGQTYSSAGCVDAGGGYLVVDNQGGIGTFTLHELDASWENPSAVFQFSPEAIEIRQDPSTGDLFFLEGNASVVRRYSATGTLLDSFTHSGTADPRGMGFDSDTGEILLADPAFASDPRVFAYSTGGTLMRIHDFVDVPAGARADGIAYSPDDGHIFLQADNPSNTVFEFAPGLPVPAAPAWERLTLVVLLAAAVPVWRRRRGQRAWVSGPPAAAILVAILLGSGPARSAAIVSAQSGPWSDASTWVPQQVPDEDDDVTIASGHTVYAGPSENRIQVLSLDVQGGLLRQRSSSEESPELRIETDTFHVSGLVQTTGGIDITVSQGESPGDCDYQISGTVRGGNNDSGDGGNVLISCFFGDEPPSMLVNTGDVIGGDGTTGGDVELVADVVHNGVQPGQPGTLLGGSGTTGRGGDAILYALFGGVARNTASSTIQGGDSDEDRGGHAILAAWESAGTATNEDEASLIGGDGCAQGCWILSGPVTNNSAILLNGSKTQGCTEDPDERCKIDPPIGTITGDSSVVATEIDLFARESLTIGSLTNANAIDAADTIDIYVAPGGTLDLTGNAPGTNWLRAGTSITIRADGGNILLDSGVALSDIMSPAPTVLAGARYTSLFALPNLDRVGLPGETLTLRFVLGNFGNEPESIDYEISDSAGWLTTISVTGAGLQPADALIIPFDLDLPSQEGSTTVTLTASTQTAGSPIDQVSRAFEVTAAIRAAAVPALSGRSLALLAALVAALGLAALVRSARRKPARLR